MPVLPPNLVEASGYTPADVIVIKTWQKSARTVTVPLRNAAGVAVSIPAGGTARLAVRETPSLPPFVTLTYTNAGQTAVTSAVFVFTAAHFIYPGLCKATITAKDSQGGILEKMNCFVDITPDGETVIDFEPMCIDVIRQQLLDRCASDNPLFSQLEFLDGEICTAICQAVDWWNETQPINSSDTTSYRAFPHTHHGAIGALAHLYLNKSRAIQRNRMALQGDGVSADDRVRAEAYAQYGEHLLTEYRSWVQGQMVRLNYDKWAGSVQDPNFEPPLLTLY